MLALLWCLVSPGAVFLLLREPVWFRAADLPAAFHAVRLEQWVAIALLLAHAWFCWRAKLRPASGSVLPASCRQRQPGEVSHK